MQPQSSLKPRPRQSWKIWRLISVFLQRLIYVFLRRLIFVFYTEVKFQTCLIYITRQTFHFPSSFQKVYSERRTELVSKLYVNHFPNFLATSIVFHSYLGYHSTPYSTQINRGFLFFKLSYDFLCFSFPSLFFGLWWMH